MLTKTKYSFLLLIILIAAISCQGPSEKKEDTAKKDDLSKELTIWLDEKYEESLQKSPLTLTTLGRKDHYGQLDDVSMKALEEEANWMQQTVEELQTKFDYEQLDKQAQ